uniref:Uncharacterized protein n=1 Tax=Tetranychus urticae TaxID=32264 RepID=T1KKZ5_TETUR
MILSDEDNRWSNLNEWKDRLEDESITNGQS